MPRLAHFRNIAIGFKEDAEELLNEFINLNTFEFSAFANIWRKRKFSLIFIGRENTQELKEFTEECFFLSSENIASTTPYLTKVAAIYLLYSLYLKQKLSPKVQIRILIHQYKELHRTLKKATEEKHKTVCYVIHYLLSCKAFNYVAFPKLMGPLTGIGPKETYATASAQIKNTADEILQSGNYEVLSKMHEKYEHAKRGLLSVNESGLSLLLENRYDDAAKKLSTLVKDEIYINESNSKSLQSVESIGEQRRSIKHKQFQKRTDHYLLKSQSESQPSEDNMETKSPRKRRVKKGRGRPRKVVEEAKSSDEELLKIVVPDEEEALVKDEEEVKPLLDEFNRVVKSRHRAKRKVHHYEEKTPYSKDS